MSTKKSAARTLVLAADRSFGRAVASGRLHARLDGGRERQVSGYNNIADLVLAVVRPLPEYAMLLIVDNGFESDCLADIAGNLILPGLRPVIDLDITNCLILRIYPGRNCSPLPSVKLALNEDFSGLLTGGGVDVEVLEEDLRVAGGGSTTLGLVVGLDVDGGGHRRQR